MPESFPSLPDARCSALEKFCSNLDLESFKDQCQGRQMTPIHTNCGNPGGNQHPLLAPSNVQTSPGSSARTRPRGSRGGAKTNPGPKKAPKGVGRKPGTSRFYGVRFRPDLRKWVAEIRVQEWKAVDKKVWLGTFGTEQAAARGVDLARKLLKCKKKHRPNLPNPKLTAYSKQIPAHLILTELGTPAMFPSTTHFIKRECKQYAASFDDDDDTPIAVQLTSPNPQSSNITGGLTSFNEAQNLYDFNAGDATSINMLDFVESEESELSSLIPFCGDLAIHDELEVDSSMTTYNRSFELGMSSSPSPSPSSSASCMTLEVVQAQSECPVVLGWESGDVGGCEDGASETMADLMDGVSMMESMMAVDGDAGAGAGVASQLWAEDASLFHFWPLPQQDPSSSCPSGYLPELPDALFGLTSYMPACPGNYIAPLDLEPWSLQGAHNPLYGPYGWH